MLHFSRFLVTECDFGQEMKGRRRQKKIGVYFGVKIEEMFNFTLIPGKNPENLGGGGLVFLEKKFFLGGG